MHKLAHNLTCYARRMQQHLRSLEAARTPESFQHAAWQFLFDEQMHSLATDAGEAAAILADGAT